MEYKNWILKEYSEVVVPVFEDFKPYYSVFLINKGVYVNIDLSKSETFIDWNEYPNHYSFWYYFEGCEEDISKRLRKSKIMQYDSIIMDFGKGNPVCQIPVIVFVDNWLDFVVGAQYLTTVVTKNGELIMEFVKGDLLNSNFEI